LACVTIALPARAATFTVNSTADAVDAHPGDGICETSPGNGFCTLRAAVQEAGALSGPQTIILPDGIYALTLTPQCSYSLVTNSNTLTENMSALCIKGNVTITGAGATTTIIDANGQNGATCCGSYPSSRGIFIDVHATLQLSGITIQNGLGNGGYTIVGGGAINNQGHLTVSGCTFTANNGVPGGGGVWNDGTLSVVNSIFDTNQSGAYGGSGIYNTGAGPATISNSTFSNSHSSTNGGAIVAMGTVSISNSAIYGNIADATGGAIYGSSGNITLTNLTVSGNQASTGGAFFSGNFGNFTANNLTIYNNKALNSAGAIAAASSFKISNSIFFGNTDGRNAPDCSFNVVSGGYNLIDTYGTGCTLAATDITNANPNLAPLTYNGGTTQTHALLPGSPAIDAGNPATPGSGGAACPATDQRGYLRPFGARCDIGAYEQNTNFLLTSVVPTHASNSGPAELTLGGGGFDSGTTAKLRRAGQSDIPGSQVSLSAAGASLTAVFDLTSQPAGAWDVVVTNSANMSITLPAAFTIDPPGSANTYVQVVGPSVVRPNTSATFFLIYGNRGNVDAYAVPVDLDVPTNLPVSVSFPITSPPAQSGQVVTDWTAVPLYATPGPSLGVVNVPLLLPIIPAGSSHVLEFKVFISSAFTEGQTIAFYATGGSPYMNPTLDPALLSQMTANAIAYAQANLGVTVSSSKTAAISAYIANQYQLAVSTGRTAYAASLGSQPLIFSQNEFVIDAAEYAAAPTSSSQTANAARSKSFSLTAKDVTNLGPLAPPKNPCSSGGVMTPGSNCNTTGDDKIPDPNTPDKPFTPADCRQLANHSVSSDGTLCRPTNKKGCGILQNVLFSDPDCLTFPIRASVDPNDKSGPTGVSTQHYLSTIPTMNYMVEFQNKPTASLPAQVVVVTDQLDGSQLDLSTFSFGPITFGNYLITPPPGTQQFSGGLDLRPANNVAVTVDASLNKATGLVTWSFATLDPISLQPTSDPAAGFLPPDVTAPQGEGRLLYTIQPRSTVATGSTICNQATVIFDTNAPISTANWCNTIDTVAPTSHVAALPPSTTNANFTVQWTGSDATSGVRSYTIYVSDNGGPFTAWLTDTTLSQSTYAGLTGHTYGFYSIATDNSLNAEATKNAAEASSTVNGAACATDVTAQFTVVQGGYRYNNATQRFVQVLTITNATNSTLTGPFALATESLSANASLYSPSGTTSCIAAGSAYQVLNSGAASWPPGQATSVTLEFTDPSKAAISYKPAILAGASR
jgi:CSLREA domain-containing protein